MTAQAVLDEARRLGITLEARGSTLHVEAPAGSLTPELRAALADRKADLLALLAPSARFVPLKGGLVVPRPALQLALVLEDRGFQMQVDADQQFQIAPIAALTVADRVGTHQWRRHLGAIVAYDAEVHEGVQ